MEDFWKSLTPFNKFKFVLSVILGIIVVIFAVLNWHSEEIHLVFAKKQIPLTLLIIFSVAAGYAISFIFSYRKFKTKDRQIRDLEDQLRDLKNKYE